MEEGFSLLTIVNKFRIQPNTRDKESFATKGFWVPLLQRLLNRLHQHNFALQVYVLNTLPKAFIYTWWNKAVSKVEEVETVKDIKVKCLTNLK